MTNELRGKIIISADDFGLSQKANENILSLVRDGKVDRVAVLTDYLSDGKDLAELAGSGIKIDLHLRLKSFDENMNRSQGVLRRSALFLWHYLSRKDSLREIETQWQEQIEKFIKRFGQAPDGINSHQYLHFFPPYFKIILRLGKKYKIPYLRFGKNGIAENINPHTKVLSAFSANKRLRNFGVGASSIPGILSWLWKRNFLQFEKFSFVSSEYLASYDWVKDFPEFLKKLPPGQTELIFHPEREDEYEIINKYF